jgi:hypothetical protein
MWATAVATAVCRVPSVAGSGSWAIRHSAVHTSAAVRAEPPGDAEIAARRSSESPAAAGPASRTTGTIDGSPRSSGRKWAKRCSERPV